MVPAHAGVIPSIPPSITGGPRGPRTCGGDPNNPIDKWCLENTALKINSKGKTMPIKIQGKEDKKIDGTVTMIMCYKIYLDNKTEYLELVNRAG